MKVKLAIIFGVCIWIITSVTTSIITPISNNNLPYENLVVPLIIIIVTTIFGILYIRNMESDEVIEGVLAGIIFVMVDVILDYFVFILPQRQNIIIGNYTFHLFSVLILTLLITTFLGYLAQMTIDLK